MPSNYKYIKNGLTELFLSSTFNGNVGNLYTDTAGDVWYLWPGVNTGQGVGLIKLTSAGVFSTPSSATIVASDGARAGINILRDATGKPFALWNRSGNDWLTVARECGGTNGVVSTTTWSNATSLTKTHAAKQIAYSAFVKDEAGHIWHFALYQFEFTIGMARLTDTNFEINSSSLAAAPIYTKTATSGNPGSIKILRFSTGKYYLFWSPGFSSTGYILQLSNSDGVITSSIFSSSSVIAYSTITSPLNILQDDGGFIWIVSFQNSNRQLRLSRISGSNGEVLGSIAETINKTLPINAAFTNDYMSCGIIKDVANVFTIAFSSATYITIQPISERNGIVSAAGVEVDSFLQLKTGGAGPGALDVQLAKDINNNYRMIVPAGYYNYNVYELTGSNNNLALAASFQGNLHTANQTASISNSLSYFHFDSGISTPTFVPQNIFTPISYTRSTDSSGIIGSGSNLLLTTDTADITSSVGITVASGATVRLGKKATYTINFFFQNGSTLQVFPDSDRSGNPVDLTNFTFAATTVINVINGTATVIVPAGASANISSGAGVTIQGPPPLIVTNLVIGSRVKITRVDTGAFLQQLEATTSTITFTFAYTGTVRVEARSATNSPAYKPWVTQVTISGTTVTIPSLQEID